MTHLEQLIFEYFNWQGYLVKHNVKVGKRTKGGWAMELDILAYNPTTHHLVHLEPSLDSHSWEKKLKRFKKKFESGRKYLFKEIFNWIDPQLEIEQIAIITSHHPSKVKLSGGLIYSVDEYVKKIVDAVSKQGKISKNAIPEQYRLLRTIQLVKNGYYKIK
jgi:hypothetical protein